MKTVADILARAQQHADDVKWQREAQYMRFRTRLQALDLLTAEYNQALARLKEILKVS